MRRHHGDGHFRPFQPLTTAPSTIDREPKLTDDERHLVLLFLCRPVRYCARLGALLKSEAAVLTHSFRTKVPHVRW